MPQGSLVNGGEVRFKRLQEVCQCFPLAGYKNADNNRLAVYAIGLLEEQGIPRTQEAITVGLFLMFPEKFSLVGFNQYPDAERANRTLLQLGKNYRNWATGNKHVGYTLTDTGRLVLEQTKKLLQNPELQLGSKRTPKERTRDPSAEVREIEASSLFQAYSDRKLETTDEFAIWALLQAFPYTPKRALKSRMKMMQQAAELAGRSDVVKFLGWVREKYREVFEEE